jgi:hypothetical protein
MTKVDEAQQALRELGFPREQYNKRSGYTLLALLDLKEDQDWKEAADPLMGITPIMNWMAEHYGKIYAPNSRESIRRKSIHQFLAAGLVVSNPDRAGRAINSGDYAYRMSPEALRLLRLYGSPRWIDALTRYLENHETLVQRYARERDMVRVPVALPDGTDIVLSAGEHSELIKAIIEEFAPRFAPGGRLVYAGDTGKKMGYFDKGLLSSLGVTIDSHGKMPDVILYYGEKDWLLLVESVTSHGPVDAKRHDELTRLFKKSSAGLVYVTAFPTRQVMGRYLADIAWETEVWVADAPTHMIHFNGVRFLGPWGKR